jgi:probable DNA repair protein
MNANDNYYKKLIQFLQRDTLVITANKRLARTIRYLCSQARAGKPSSIIQLTEILTLDAFIEKCWKQYQSSQKNSSQESRLTPMSPQMSYWIWHQSIIASSTKIEGYQNPRLVDLAQTAWTFLKHFRVSLKSLKHFPLLDIQNFLQYAENFNIHCEKHGWIDPPRLIEKIIFLVEESALSPPRHILLAGFLEFSPLEQKLWSTLKNKGCHIDTLTMKSPCNQKTRLALPNSEIEMYTMARYAIHRAKQDPSQSTLCVIYNLHEVRTDVERIFREVLAETSDIPYEKMVNISIGKRMSDEPLIKVAFDILRFKVQRLTASHLTALLLSPYLLNNTAHLSERALLDAAICKIGNVEYSLIQFINVISSFENQNALLNALGHLVAFDTTSHRPFGDWANQWMDMLVSVSWADPTILNPREKELLERFQCLLKEEAPTLNPVFPSLSFFGGIQVLKKLAEKTLFRAKTEDTHTPIQILGLLESLGQPTDTLWMMGMNDREFPAKSAPNPFIPIRLQRQARMPHADADREWQFSQRALTMLLTHCQQAIFSYSEQDDDETLLPCSMIQQVPVSTLAHLDLPEFKSPAEKQFKTASLTCIDDLTAPPIQHDGTDASIKGGTDCLKQQSLCPFRAFAKHRLKAQPLETPQLGLSPRERGMLIHDVLERFWRNIVTQELLIHLDKNELRAQIDHCVKQSFKTIISPHKQLSRAFKEIEQTRLNELLYQWIQIEKSRPPFRVISQEKTQQLRLKQLSFTVRIDRVDQTESGIILIDYKTGQSNIYAWFGERLEEPQLPMYAIAMEKPISAIAFAQINAGESMFKSISDVNHILPGNKWLNTVKVCPKPADWGHQLNRWQQTLENLADNFYSGLADIDPKQPQICEGCPYQLLCRIKI